MTWDQFQFVFLPILLVAYVGYPIGFLVGSLLLYRRRRSVLSAVMVLSMLGCSLLRMVSVLFRPVAEITEEHLRNTQLQEGAICILQLMFAVALVMTIWRIAPSPKTSYG